MNKAYMTRCIQATGEVLRQQEQLLTKQAAGTADRIDNLGILTSDGKGEVCVEDRILSKAASFGPDVRQMGIKPATAAYYDTGKPTNRAVVRTVFEIFKRVENYNGDSPDMSDYLMPIQGAELVRAREHIISASVALKLMLRTYVELKKDKKAGNQAGVQGSDDA